MSGWTETLDAIEHELAAAEHVMAEGVVPGSARLQGVSVTEPAGTEPAGTELAATELAATEAASTEPTGADLSGIGSAAATGAVGFTPSPDLGPLPPALAARARSLVARTEEVQMAIRDRMVDLDRQRAQLGVRRQALTAYVTADQAGNDTTRG